MNPNVYVPYPIPQTTEEAEQSFNAIIMQNGVPQSLQDAWLNVINSSVTASDVNNAEANGNSMDNE